MLPSYINVTLYQQSILRIIIHSLGYPESIADIFVITLHWDFVIAHFLLDLNVGLLYFKHDANCRGWQNSTGTMFFIKLDFLSGSKG